MSTQTWMFLCKKMEDSKKTNSQLKNYAIEEGINPKGKSRKELCKELAKIYDQQLKLENKILNISSNEEELILKLSKLIDNYENGYRNYFEPEDINNWNEGKGTYEYHEVLYNVKTLNVIKQNKDKLEELYSFKNFPSFVELLKLLILSIEKIPIKERQKYVTNLKDIFTEDSEKNDKIGDEEKMFEYEYENEYGVQKSVK